MKLLSDGTLMLLRRSDLRLSEAMSVIDETRNVIQFVMDACGDKTIDNPQVQEKLDYDVLT